MSGKVFLPILAFCGISFSIFMIYWSQLEPPTHEVTASLPQSPFLHYVSGEGVITSVDEDVKIGVPFPDLITAIYVETGDYVHGGSTLFKLDTRQKEADLKEALMVFNKSKTIYEDKKQQFIFYENVKNKNAVSEQEYLSAYYEKQEAFNSVQVALATITRIKTTIERAYIRAPYDGVVLQSNVRLGEFANVNPFDRAPLIIFGKAHPFELRVSIAEEDAWRVFSGAQGVAFVRGNASISFDLEFKHIEPYLSPKESLRGTDVERVDTRVLNIVYEFNPVNSPVYSGQLLDVYLEARESLIS